MKKNKNLMRVFTLLLVLVGVSSSAFGAYYMKHPWGGGNWEYKQLDGNNQITAEYGGNGVNIATSSSGAGEIWIATPTLVGNPTTGTTCIFKYNPASKTVTITAIGGGGGSTTISGMYIIGEAVAGWDTFTPMTKESNGEFSSSILSSREFKFTSQSNWGDASQTIFNESSADNTKSVGVTVDKVDNGGNTNAKATLESGYEEPITFYINTSTKKFWAVATKDVTFDLTASKYDYDTANAPSELILKVSSDNTTTGDFIWSSSTDGTNYTEISGVTGDTYTLSGADVPMKTVYYKVKRKKSSSSDYLEDSVTIVVYQTCGEGTKGSNLFKITFDDDTKLKTLLGDGSRMMYDAMITEYAYAEAPKKINDGQYAIVTEPLYCGYGEGGKDECGTDLGCIEEKIKTNPNDRWFRGFRDHTQNKGGVNSTYGGMLLINFGEIKAGNEESGVAFSRILTEDETSDFTNGATLTFSAYMASAAVEKKYNAEGQLIDFAPIDAELKIQFKKTGKTEWETVASIESQVEYKDDWKRFTTSLKITDIKGEFRVVIKNNGSTGSGNDLLIDDISLDLCSPTISVEFADKQTEDYTFTSVDDVVSVRVPKVNFGSISDPCLMLFGINENGEYGFIAEMLEEGDYYVAKDAISGIDLVQMEDDGSRAIKPRQLQAVVSEKVNGNCSDEVMQGVVGGRYQPGTDLMVVFSSNTLSVDMECLDSEIILLEGESSNVCYSSEMVMPTIKLTSNNLTSSVYLDILVNGEVLIEGVGFEVEENEDFMLINLSELYAESKQETYLPEVGELKVTVKVRESYVDGVLCEREAEGVVTINIIDHSDAPVAKRPGERYSYNMCMTEGENPEPDVLDDIIYFKDLIEDEDKSGLVWLDLNNNIIPEEEAFFYADKVQDKSVKVYNNPLGACPSDTIMVYYRVKEITEPIKVKDYNKCAVELQEGETASLIPLADLVENADNYKYLIFTDSVSVNVIDFDASKPGSATYNIVASQDELQSADNNYCEAKATVSTNIKDNAKKTNIVAKGAEVCPGTLVELTANEEFAENQNGVIIRWYSDASLEKDFLLHTGATYTIEKAIEDATLYVTVETDKYCENIPAEARPVNVTLKAASPQISLEPKEQVIAIGGVAELKVSPAEVSTAPQLQLYANDVLQGEGPVRPYIDTEYKMIYNGECGVTSAKANVTVQWPTVFTPYVKDGRNDTFVTDMNPNFYTQIFTRFGTKIYESENGWDGSINGSMNGSSEIAAPGVYYYVVDLPDGNVKKGTIEVFKY